jgi:NAD(P)-dependent dehydrogenase (short-subunit alcohol dehydrogenase family)
MTTDQEPTIDYSFGLEGKRAVVVGGASGIGAAITEVFAAKGARVAVLDRDEEGAVRQAGRAGDSCMGLACEVTDRASIDAAVARVVDEFGGIDILVNCAGVATLLPAEEMPEEEWDRQLDINLKGCFLVCQAVGRHMLAARSGRIVSIASIAGNVALDKHVAYCASKFGMIGMTKVLASEWAGRGVTVNTISPTVVLTELGKSFWHGPSAEQMKATMPTLRFAYPNEIAAAALFLVSEAAGMINGVDLLVDGGYTIR